MFQCLPIDMPLQESACTFIACLASSRFYVQDRRQVQSDLCLQWICRITDELPIHGTRDMKGDDIGIPCSQGLKDVILKKT